jgi:hypothetical protein
LPPQVLTLLFTPAIEVLLCLAARVGGRRGQSFVLLYFQLVIGVLVPLAIALQIALYPRPIVLAVESGKHDLLLRVRPFLLPLSVLLLLRFDELLIETLDLLLVVFDLLLHLGMHHFQLFQLPHLLALLLLQPALQVLLVRLQSLILLPQPFVVHFEQFDLIPVFIEDVLVFIVFLDYFGVVQVF